MHNSAGAGKIAAVKARLVKGRIAYE